MLRIGSITLCMGGVIVTAASAFALSGKGDTPTAPAAINKGAVINSFLNENPRNDFKYAGDRIDRVFGPAFSTGQTVEDSAERFRQTYSGMWGVPAEDLVQVGPFEDGRHLQPIMYNPETGQYKFTGAYYTQVRDDVPVFRSKLIALIRNEPGYPMVLASSSLRDLGTFHVAEALQAAGDGNAAMLAVKKLVGDQAHISEPEMVIWAGVDDVSAQPRLAMQYITETLGAEVSEYQKWLFLADAITGDILFQESMIHEVDIAGNVSGMATTGNAADVCSGIAPMALPYARVTAGATTVYADANGNYVLPNAGASAVNVTSAISGLYFNLTNFNGTSTGSPGTSITQGVTPPGPGNFLHNAANTSAFNRAEVNAYIHANKARDYILTYNPSYPTIAGQTGFAVNVNINQSCNAFYNGTSINFYIAGGSCTNTANSTVVNHEYGHHMVASGGSGQGAYGEGMSDCLAVLITDDSCLGNGFNAGCGACLRNANNNCQYIAGTSCSSCGSAIHSCGQLISGCVWSTRTNLLATHPATYRDIISNLTINSVLLHTGTTITPSITVDFLTLDDDDADISNGTPHYNQINGGFSAHNMPGPALAPILISYPNGKPTHVSPSGGTTMRVHVNAGSGTPQQNTGILHVSTGGGFVQVPMTQISPNVYDAVFPASNCGASVRYYVTAQSTSAQTISSPGNAPSSFFTAISGISFGAIEFADDFNTNQGWAATNTGTLTGGAWQRAIPRTDCSRGNPTSDADGSGWAFLTQNDNGPAGDVCNSDIDGGVTTLTSPIMDASNGVNVLSYWRWYDNIHPNNTNQDDPFVVEFSINGGSSWMNLETVGPAGPETNGGWVFKQIGLSSVPGFTPTSQFRVRFVAQDLGVASVVEAAVDGVKLQKLNCTNTCVADTNGSGTVDVTDLLAVINAWGPCPGCPADVNGSGTVDVTDLLAIINGWGACP